MVALLLPCPPSHQTTSSCQGRRPPRGSLSKNGRTFSFKFLPSGSACKAGSIFGVVFLIFLFRSFCPSSNHPRSLSLKNPESPQDMRFPTGCKRRRSGEAVLRRKERAVFSRSSSGSGGGCRAGGRSFC